MIKKLNATFVPGVYEVPVTKFILVKFVTGTEF